MRRDDLRCIYAIAVKDMRTYYLKPPSISWGIFFPIFWIFAFYLRNPGNFADLIPGLTAMTILFATTAAESVVINFELRYGTFERLLLAPVSAGVVLTGKIIGGAFFGILMTTIVTTGSILLFGLSPDLLALALMILPSILVFSSLGALLCVAVKEIYEAQLLLNFPRFLMTFLSGILYPVSAMPSFLQLLAAFMPLTYTVNGLRDSFAGASFESVLPSSLLLSAVFIAFTFLAVILLRRKFE